VSARVDFLTAVNKLDAMLLQIGFVLPGSLEYSTKPHRLRATHADRF
jgi:hypothetical protein